jgi:VIT1/CCC1 family predicted Fe2+/Mn2+ transporter
MMLKTRRSGKHFTASATVRDIVTGISDGLTVTFVIATGHSEVVASTHAVVVAVLVEIAIGLIALGLSQWVDFTRRFEPSRKLPYPKRTRQSAFTRAIAYLVGGLASLTPYLLLPNVSQALPFSIVFTLLAFFIFGYVKGIKGRFIGLKPLKSGFQNLLIGGLLSTTLFIIAQLFK